MRGEEAAATHSLCFLLNISMFGLLKSSGSCSVEHDAFDPPVTKKMMGLVSESEVQT